MTTFGPTVGDLGETPIPEWMVCQGLRYEFSGVTSTREPLEQPDGTVVLPPGIKMRPVSEQTCPEVDLTTTQPFGGS